MTTNDRIEAAVQAEAKRIAAWNQSGWIAQAPETRQRAEPALSLFEVRALANHLVRNRIQVEDARRKALVDALRIAQRRFSEQNGRVSVEVWNENYQAVHAIQAALKLEEEA